MQIRLLQGLYFFQDSTGQNADNKQASMDLLKRYFYASELLKRAFKESNVIEREDRT